MSALNLWMQSNAVHLITDGLAYLPDGSHTDEGGKILQLPKLGMAIGLMGGCTSRRVSEGLDTRMEWISTPEALLGALSSVLIDLRYENSLDPRRAALEPVGGNEIVALVAGWDREADEPAAWVIHTGSTLPGFENIPPLEPTRVWGWTAPPVELPELLTSYRLNPEQHGLEVLLRQRASGYTPPGLPCGTYVGGEVEAVTVTREGIYQRVLGRLTPEHI